MLVIPKSTDFSQTNFLSYYTSEPHQAQEFSTQSIIYYFFNTSKEKKAYSIFQINEYLLTTTLTSKSSGLSEPTQLLSSSLKYIKLKSNLYFYSSTAYISYSPNAAPLSHNAYGNTTAYTPRMPQFYRRLLSFWNQIPATDTDRTISTTTTHRFLFSPTGE